MGEYSEVTISSLRVAFRVEAVWRVIRGGRTSYEVGIQYADVTGLFPKVQTTPCLPPCRFRHTIMVMALDALLKMADDWMIDQREQLGTIFLVDKQWYARLETFGGVLFPMHLNSVDESWKDGLLVKVGRMSFDHRGFPRSIEIATVIQAGTKNEK